MKKLLIGCGCLVALGIAALGWLAWQVVPSIQQTMEQAEVAQRRMLELDAQSPFDPAAQVELDAERFARALDLRLPLVDEYTRWEASMNTTGQDAEWTDLIDVVTGAMSQFASLFELLPDTLEGQGMGPSEFIWHSRVLWAALDSVASGAGGTELDPLRDEYDTMRGAYGELRKQDNQLPSSFEALVGEIDPAFALTARQVLASDPDRAQSAVGNPGMEVMLLRVPEMLQAFAAGGVDVRVEGVPVSPDAPMQPLPDESR